MMTDCRYNVYGTEGHEEKTMGQWRDRELELAAGFSTGNLVGGSRGKEDFRNTVQSNGGRQPVLNVSGSCDGEVSGYFGERKNLDESSRHPPSTMSLNQEMLVCYFAFWVAVIRSSKPLTMAVSAQPGFKRDPSTWKVCAPNAVSLGM